MFSTSQLTIEFAAGSHFQKQFQDLHTEINQLQTKHQKPYEQPFINSLKNLCHNLATNIMLQIKNDTPENEIHISDASLLAHETLEFTRKLNHIHQHSENQKEAYDIAFDNYREMCEEIFSNDLPNTLAKLILTGMAFLAVASIHKFLNQPPSRESTKLFGACTAGALTGIYLFSKTKLNKQTDDVLKEGENLVSHLTPSNPLALD